MLFASRSFRIAAVCAVHIATSTGAFAQEPFDRSRDRGEGLPLSMFGTYIRSGQLVVMPVLRKCTATTTSVRSGELGSRARPSCAGASTRTNVSCSSLRVLENIAAEFEIAGISASLDKSPLDDSALPPRLEHRALATSRAAPLAMEEGIRHAAGAVQLLRDRVSRAAVEALIGTPDWELKFGFGLTRGLRWGTISARRSLGMPTAPGSWESTRSSAEARVEPAAALRRSRRQRGRARADHGSQILLTTRIVLKLNNSFGLTSKATDWAPEIGVMFFIR